MKPHQCEYLAYREMTCELVHPRTDRAWAGQRWALLDSAGEVVLQVVMFCPYCGEDFRADLDWQIPGRPQENSLLRSARAAGRRPRCICHGPDMIAGVCPVHGAPGAAVPEARCGRCGAIFPAESMGCPTCGVHPDITEVGDDEG